jgi:two-component system, OmpR family, phosphate regulon sensor histidine kinase PhoR
MVKLLGRPRRHHSSVEHERLLSLMNSMADGVIAVDQHLDVVLSNGAAQNILDINTSIQGRPLRNLFKPQDKNNQPVNVTTLIHETVTSYNSRDLHLHYADGSDAALYVSIAPVHLGFGERGIHGFVILLRDITREKSLEDERDEFISVVSHELRTPIAIAEGNISNAMFIAEKTQDMNAIKKALKEAHDQTIFLSNMINDLATLSRAERGKLNVEVTKIDVAAFLQSLANDYTAEVKLRKLSLRTKVAPGAEVLLSSELYVREILQNFITNSLKYTEKGSITIQASSQEQGILFSVSDTGIGISKSDQEKVFDKFFRSEDFRTRKTNGTGLGLYVVMKLSRLLHAEINLKSRLNEGSTFSISVPNLQPPSPSASEDGR